MSTGPAYRVHPVTTSADMQAFLDLPRRLYAQDPHWVCPLDLEIRNVFDPHKNTFFQHGRAQLFVLFRQQRVVGRVAAFINDRRAHKFEVPTGGIGFFEVENDPHAARMLFDAARQWLEGHGMEAMDGPINFGENHQFWGLLVEGFRTSGYGMPYNPPWYRSFFEDYGFYFYFEQMTKRLDAQKPLPERFAKIGSWKAEKGGVTVLPATPDRIAGMTEDFRTIYNDAWQHHENFAPMTADAAQKIVGQLKPVLIPELVWFAYVEGEPAGFVVALPDLNQIFAPWKGKLNLWRGLLFAWRRRNRFAWYRQKGILTRARTIIGGVRPKFQRHGVEVAIIMEMQRNIPPMGFREMEIGWVGDFNPPMQALAEATGAEFYQRHYTYRFIFDPVRNAEAKRSAIIPWEHRSPSSPNP